ncbi:MAG: disulfide bond formation protein DsbB [Oleiphilaceae bacterium]|jgi:disulfide bond formation protein DsbB
MISAKPRLLFFLIFIGCAALLTTAIFIAPFKDMNPCPMCMMQRAVFLALGALAAIAALHNPVYLGQKIYALFLALISIGGASIAIRQLWLQSLPEDQIPACGPGLDYMIDVFPLLEVIEMSLRGTGDCAKVQWTLFNLSIPAWSLIVFIGITVLAIFILFKKRANQA